MIELAEDLSEYRIRTFRHGDEISRAHNNKSIDRSSKSQFFTSSGMVLSLLEITLQQHGGKGI